MPAKETIETKETEKTRDQIDPKSFGISLDMNELNEIFEITKKTQENREAIKDFIDEMNNDIIPEVDLAVNSLIHTYAYRKEIEAVKMVWRCFEQIVSLDNSKVNTIIALEIQELKKKRGQK